MLKKVNQKSCEAKNRGLKQYRRLVLPYWYKITDFLSFFVNKFAYIGKLL